MIRYKASFLKNDCLFFMGSHPIMFDPFKRTRELTTIISNILKNKQCGLCCFSRAWVDVAQLVQHVYATFSFIRWWQWLLNVSTFFASLIILMKIRNNIILFTRTDFLALDSPQMKFCKFPLSLILTCTLFHCF